ncbi:OmpP1/FadL family transporter [Pontibacter chinhatensis]|uniref:Long-chain fatty acid transport protein n=1 Tax=Pontibacter chinhatensis TaxID=1436961 RepID=A0A1I2U237_9BACT|nr:outer membrane protein transport protein [Pontibacter chinhatensis]SFG71215.1 long-chain fatty acid transport protein [Pontibacter chinhatensis]
MKSRILALLGGTLLSASAMAGGYQVNLASQRQIGMGHTGTGLVTGTSSIFFNPGAMSYVRENGVTIGASALFSKIAYSAPESNGVTARTDNPVGTPFQVYAVYKINDKLAAGLGVYTPFGSTAKWGQEWSGRFGLEELSLSAIFFQPTLSYAITDKLGIGAGLTYVKGSVNLQRGIPVQDEAGNYGRAELDGDGTSLGYNVGIYFKPSEKLSLGINYRSRVDVDVEEGDATFTVAPSLKSRFPDTKFGASLPLPATLSVGIGFMPTEALTIAVDVNRVEWSAYESLRFDYKDAVNGSNFTENARNYEDAYIYRIGAEYKATEALALRAGAYYDSSPVQDGYLTPETPDADARGLSVGLGYSVSDNIKLDASFLYINKKERTDASDKSGGIGGTYKAVAYIPGLALTYNF